MATRIERHYIAKFTGGSAKSSFAVVRHESPAVDNVSVPSFVMIAGTGQLGLTAADLREIISQCEAALTGA